jgi:hypothetical protein
MIECRGWGLLIPVIALGCFALTSAVVSTVWNVSYLEDHRWPTAVTCLATAAIIWPLGLWLNRKSDLDEGARLTQDEQLDRAFRSRHSLISIPFEYWAPIVAFGGIVYIFTP